MAKPASCVLIEEIHHRDQVLFQGVCTTCSGTAVGAAWRDTTSRRRRRMRKDCCTALFESPVSDAIRCRLTATRRGLRPAPCTPFVRRRQFAAVAAATRLRVDVGLRFTRAPESGILSVANGPGQATHRLSLTSPGDVTGEVGRLLRAAYEQNG